jgi:hypothetical protein
MKLQVIQESIPRFVDVLKSENGHLHQYKYDILSHFGQSWTFDTEDFAKMYDSALQCNVTQRWWKREHYRPKEMMLLFIGSEEQYVRQVFKELLNEQKSVENRIDSFSYYCDEIVRMYKRAFPKSIVNNHYQDSTMISLYLSAISPSKYTLYPGRDVFNRALSTLQARQSTDKDDLVRYFKVCKTLYDLLMRDASVNAIIESGLRPHNHLLLVHELLYFLAGSWSDHVP